MYSELWEREPDAFFIKCQDIPSSSFQPSYPALSKSAFSSVKFCK